MRSLIQPDSKASPAAVGLVGGAIFLCVFPLISTLPLPPLALLGCAFGAVAMVTAAWVVQARHQTREG